MHLHCDYLQLEHLKDLFFFSSTFIDKFLMTFQFFLLSLIFKNFYDFLS